MGQHHTVVQGEHLSKIARMYGFASYLTIWDAPENKDLKQERKNPNVLYPGDQLYIPDKETKEESRSTDKQYKFQTDREKLLLRIKLADLRNHPLQNHDCTLSFDTDSKDFTTKTDGILEREIIDHKKTAQASLLDKGDPKTPASIRIERKIPLRIGDLNPKDKPSGQIARLNNLGYNAGELPEHPPGSPITENEEQALGSTPQFKSAVEEFQCDFMGQNNLATIKIVVDGICGEQTQNKLLEAHGC